MVVCMKFDGIINSAVRYYWMVVRVNIDGIATERSELGAAKFRRARLLNGCTCEV
jgi:hypothetical protein